MATKAVAKSFSGGGEAVFTSDDDPLLVEDALPLLLKINEMLMVNDPDNHELKASAGKLFIVYSNLFIQTPADMLDYTEWKKQSQMHARAKKMYIRGCSYLKESIELKHKIKIDLSDKKSIEAEYEESDADSLYWLGGGLMSAITIDLTDPYLAPLRNTALEVMFIAYSLDPDMGQGALHEYFLRYYSSIPESMGGSLEKAEYHFKKAIQLSEGSKISPYIAYATSVSVKNQSREGLEDFKKMLETALKFDIDSYPENRLENTVMQQKAAWYLENVDNFFLVD
ncbi:MAG: TRAP transporter TatT component family protein [Spirochaetia bacterium]|nr:TRAP transporter TatT component family protein [Spirochaetia bacterium]